MFEFTFNELTELGYEFTKAEKELITTCNRIKYEILDAGNAAGNFDIDGHKFVKTSDMRFAKMAARILKLSDNYYQMTRSQEYIYDAYQDQLVILAEGGENQKLA